jgi:hypothetical protein
VAIFFNYDATKKNLVEVISNFHCTLVNQIEMNYYIFIPSAPRTLACPKKYEGIDNLVCG